MIYCLYCLKFSFQKVYNCFKIAFFDRGLGDAAIVANHESTRVGQNDKFIAYRVRLGEKFIFKVNFTKCPSRHCSL